MSEEVEKEVQHDTFINALGLAGKMAGSSFLVLVIRLWGPIRAGRTSRPTPSAVAAALRRVKNDPELRTRLEANAEDWTAAHDWAQIVPRIDRVLAG